jgi:methylated-DNA-[protein]-cysteine S-methyltransferase
MPKNKRLQRLNSHTLQLSYKEISSPVGKLCLVASPEGLNALLWDEEWDSAEGEILRSNYKHSNSNEIILKCERQLTEYFEGRRTTFQLPLCLNGTTFQQQAWTVLQTIPYGETFSYKKQAQALGDEKKARAVGYANSQNPISIIIPCHRVIGSNKALTGFAGGLAKKAFLLDFEQQNR